MQLRFSCNCCRVVAPMMVLATNGRLPQEASAMRCCERVRALRQVCIGRHSRTRRSGFCVALAEFRKQCIRPMLAGIIMYFPDSRPKARGTVGQQADMLAVTHFRAARPLSKWRGLHCQVVSVLDNGRCAAAPYRSATFTSTTPQGVSLAQAGCGRTLPLSTSSETLSAALHRCSRMLQRRDRKSSSANMGTFACRPVYLVTGRHSQSANGAGWY